jgi:2-iminobutanoate/2-iminopropanoate deaminase
MKYEVVQSPEVHEPMGREYAGMPIYSLAFSVDLKTFDRLVIIAGQVPLDKQGKMVSDDFADQFHQVFSNLKATLEAAGGKMENIISLRTLLSREDDLPIFHRLRGEFYPQLFEGKPLPPNTLLVVKQLVSPEIRLEIEAIAAI